jgi:hypothetical protein
MQLRQFISTPSGYLSPTAALIDHPSDVDGTPLTGARSRVACAAMALVESEWMVRLNLIAS